MDIYNEDMTMLEQDTGTYVHTFRTPFTYEGKTFSSVSFDFDRLTGNDALAIEAEMQAMGKPVIIPSLSGDYLIRMAARACSEQVGADFFGTMPLREYQAIRSKARNFLLKSES